MPLSRRPGESPGGRRRGSPWTGLGTVVAKETADHLSGARMVVIEALVFLVALVLAWFSTTTIRESIGQSPFLFLRLLTISPDPIPFSFIGMVGLVTPIIAIALGFDAISPVSCGQIRMKLCDTGKGAPSSAPRSWLTKTGPSARVWGCNKANAVSL